MWEREEQRESEAIEREGEAIKRYTESGEQMQERTREREDVRSMTTLIERKYRPEENEIDRWRGRKRDEGTERRLFMVTEDKRRRWKRERKRETENETKQWQQPKNNTDGS